MNSINASNDVLRADSEPKRVGFARSAAAFGCLVGMNARLNENIQGVAGVNPTHSTETHFNKEPK